MRRRDFSAERDEFRRRYIEHAAHFTLLPDDLYAALERGLGLDDDVMITDWSYDSSMRAWTVGVIGPRFPTVEQGKESRQVQLIHQQARFEGVAQ